MPDEPFKPDFTKSNPWEGITKEYIEKEEAAYKPTEDQPLPPSQRTEEGIAAREAALEPEPEPPSEAPLPPSTGWKPDLTKGADAFEGMPQEYVELEAATFKPTEEQPLPPSQRTPEGIEAREKAPEVSAGIADIQLVAGSTSDKPVLSREDYAIFQGLQDEQKFVKLMELGVVEEGSEFVPGFKITYGEGVPIEERVLKPKDWGIYTPEQVAEMAVTKAKRDEINDVIAQLGEYENLAVAIREGKIDLVRKAQELGLFGEVIEATKGDLIRLRDGGTVSETWFRNLPDDLQRLGWDKGKLALEDYYQTIVVTAQLDAAAIGSFEDLVATMPAGHQKAYADGGVKGLNDFILRNEEEFISDILPKQLQYLQDVFNSTEGDFNTKLKAFNDAVAEYNRMRGEARAVYPPKGESYWISKELLDRVESDKFEEKFATMMQPAGMSDEDYALIRQFILPSGLNSQGAYDAGASSDLINQYVLASSTQEFRDRVSSGELILLPYGQPITKESMEKLPTPTQDILNESGIVGLEAYQKQVKADNEAENSIKNTIDALYLSTTGMVHDLYSFGLANLQGLFGDVKEGDMKEVYKYNPEIAQATAIASIFMKDPPSMFYTAEEAAEENKKLADIRAALVDMYEEAQKVRADWVASHPELQPVYPAGVLQSVKDNPLTILDPLLYAETIANTMPYTLSTLGVMVAGGLAGGVPGFMAGSAVAFGITMGVEGHGIYEDALANGATRERARDLMNTYGAMSAAVETVGDALFIYVLGGMTKAVMPSLGRNVADGMIRGAAAKYGWANLTADVVINFVNQGSQEFIQEIIHNAAVKTVNENRPLLLGAADAFVAGVVGTAPFVLIPAGATAVKLVTTPTAEELASGALAIGVADQAKILDKVLQSIEGYINPAMVTKPADARNIASLYNDMGAKVQEYASIMLEMKQVQKGIAEVGLAKTPAEADLLKQLKDKETALQAKLDELGPSLQKSVKTYTDAMVESIAVDDKSALKEIKKMPGRILGDIDSVTSQLFGTRTALVIARDIQEIQAQISDVEREMKGGVTSAQSAAYGELISGLNSEISALNNELRLRYISTGEEVRTTKQGRLIMAVTSLQQRLVEAAGEVAEARTEPEEMERRGEPHLMKLRVVRTPWVDILGLELPKVDLSARAGADLYGAGYSLGSTISTVKNIPDNTLIALYDGAGAVDNAIARASATYRISQYYLTQELPAEIRVSLTKTRLDLETAVANAQKAAIEAKDFITKGLPKKATGLFKKAVLALNKAIAATKAAIARAQVFITKDIPVVARDAYVATISEINIASARAGAMISRANFYLTKDLPSATANRLRSAVKATEDAISRYYQTVATMREVAEEKVAESIREVAEAVRKAIAKLEQALIEAGKFITETIPRVTVKATAEAIEGAIKVVDNAVARADSVLKAVRSAITKDMPRATRDALRKVEADLVEAIDEAKRAVAQAKQFIVEGVPEKAGEILQRAAMKLDAAMARANTVLISYGEFVAETIPEVATRAMTRTIESISDVTTKAVGIARDIKNLAVVTMPKASKDALINIAKKTTNVARQARRSLGEARKLIASGLHDAALTTLRKVASDIESSLNATRTLLAQAKSGAISLPSATVKALEAAEALLYNLSVQVRIDIARAEGYMRGVPSNVVASVRGELYDIQQMRESFTGQFTMGLGDATARKGRAGSWVRELQKVAGIQKRLQQRDVKERDLWGEEIEREELADMLQLAFVMKEKDIVEAIQETTEPVWGREDYSGLLAELNEALSILRERGEISDDVFNEITKYLNEREAKEKEERGPEIKPPTEEQLELTPERQAEIGRMKEIAERVAAEPKEWELTPEKRAEIAAEAARMKVLPSPITKATEAEAVTEAERKQRLAERAEKAKMAVLETVAPEIGIDARAKILIDQAVEEGVEAYTEAITQGATLAEAEVATQQAIQQAIQEATQQATQLKSAVQVQQATEVAAQVATEPAIQMATKVAIQTATKVGIIPLPLPPLIPGLSKAEARAQEEKIKTGAIGWRQGEVSSGGERVDVWWVVNKPYTSNKDRFLYLGKPSMAKVPKGELTAYNTIQLLKGRVSPSHLTIDMGIMDVIISNPTKKPGYPGAIKFKPDKERKTLGQISLSLSGARRRRPIKKVRKQRRRETTNALSVSGVR